MGMTMTEKILARHAGRPEVSAGATFWYRRWIWCWLTILPVRRLLMSSKK